MSWLCGVRWKASVRACGHIFVRHHQEHGEAVIPASEEGAFISIWFSKDHLYARNVRAPFHSKFLWCFILVEDKFPIITQGLTSSSDSGVWRGFPGLGGAEWWWDDQAGRLIPVLHSRFLSGSPWADHLSTLFRMFRRKLGEHENAGSKANLSYSFAHCHISVSPALFLASTLE